MSRDRDLEPVSDSIDEMFTRLGLPDPEVAAALSSEWEALAGPPWSGRSRPLYVRGATLVVEATSASMIAFLRYGEADLLEKLEKRFGRRVVETVDIQLPGRG